MNPNTEQAIRDHAQAEYPRECCGVVHIVNGKERYYPCRNIADTPGEHFVMDHVELARAEDAGEIIAYVHSHPNTPATPSEADLTQCEVWKLPWHIVRVDADGAKELVTFAPSGYVAPLIGRQFSHGVNDCYTLIRDWYKREREITLPDFHRRDDWWEKGDNLYMDNFAFAGFEPIPHGAPLEVGDVVLMQYRAKVANHAGIYIGDDLILHHLALRLSSRDVYDGYFQEITRIVVRYKKC